MKCPRKVTYAYIEASSLLIYNKWVSEYDLLKLVKNETDDGSDPDYVQMYQIRLENHTKSEAGWRMLKEEAILLLTQFMFEAGVEL